MLSLLPHPHLPNKQSFSVYILQEVSIHMAYTYSFLCILHRYFNITTNDAFQLQLSVNDLHFKVQLLSQKQLSVSTTAACG